MATFFLSAALPRIVSMAVKTFSAVKASSAPFEAHGEDPFSGRRGDGKRLQFREFFRPQLWEAGSGYMDSPSSRRW